MGVFKNLDVCLQDYCEHLNRDYGKNHYRNLRFEYTVGNKYVHVFSNDDTSRSSHSWILIKDDAKFKQGDILKSAGWKVPARNFVRGNVLNGDYTNIRWCGI